MNVDTMLSNLGIRLNDVSETRFKEADKLSALNSAQEDIASFASTELLRTAQAYHDFTATVNGYSLPSDYFRFVNAKLRALNPVKFITKVDMEDAGREGNRYLKGTNSGPTCHIWNNLFYLNVTTFTGNYVLVRLYYIHTPTPLVSGGTCDLDPKLHPALLDLVEGTLRANAKLGDMQEALMLQKQAIEKVNALSGSVKERE